MKITASQITRTLLPYLVTFQPSAQNTTITLVSSDNKSQEHDYFSIIKSSINQSSLFAKVELTPASFVSKINGLTRVTVVTDNLVEAGEIVGLGLNGFGNKYKPFVA